jgi:hypothetical protein
VARYKGTGEPTYAANFACIVDHRDSNGPRLGDFVTARDRSDDARGPN